MSIEDYVLESPRNFHETLNDMMDSLSDREYSALYRAVREVATKHKMFTTDSIWDAIGEEPIHERRLLGPVLREAIANGIMEPYVCSACGGERYTLSERQEAHQSPKRIYISNIYKEGGDGI